MLQVIQGDCLEVMENLKADVILTSPPYNTSRRHNTEAALNNHDARYENFIEARTADEYAAWVCKLFNKFDKVLAKNGVVIWNASYSSASSKSEFECVNSLWYSIARIIKETNFVIADKITWLKACALPNNSSPNKLTRICEDVFIFCRESEYKTFYANKKITSISKKGQPFYQVIYNLVKAKNNDGSNPLNKATFSTEFAKQLLSIYAPPQATVLDPFMGTGTTLNACKELWLDGIGIEISEKQVEFAKKRLGLN